MHEINIDSIDLLHHVVVLSTDEHVPITDLIAEDGGLTVDGRLAVAVVGRMADGKWLAAEVMRQERSISLQ